MKKNEYTESFIERLMNRGLDNYSRKELDAELLGLIFTWKKNITNLSLFEKSKKLKMTHSKLKSLIYEMHLIDNGNVVMNLSKKIDENLPSAYIKKGKVILEIDDQFLKNELKDLLKKENTITDSSFNGDIVKIPINSFVKVTKIILPDKIEDIDSLVDDSLKDISLEILSTINIPCTQLNSGDIFKFFKSISKTISKSVQPK